MQRDRRTGPDVLAAELLSRVTGPDTRARDLLPRLLKVRSNWNRGLAVARWEALSVYE